jgi:hypothetical protein
MIDKKFLNSALHDLTEEKQPNAFDSGIYCLMIGALSGSSRKIVDKNRS